MVIEKYLSFNISVASGPHCPELGKVSNLCRIVNASPKGMIRRVAFNDHFGEDLLEVYKGFFRIDFSITLGLVFNKTKKERICLVNNQKDTVLR